MSKRTALYRAFDATGKLLYVGITTNPRQRWNEHALSKVWWRQDVDRTEVEWFDTRTEAAIAEAHVVRAEGPTRNLALPAEDGSSSFQLITPKPRAAPERRTEATPRRRAMKGNRVKVAQELWGSFGQAVERSPDPEADRSKVLRAFIRWYVGETERLPESPSQP